MAYGNPGIQNTLRDVSGTGGAMRTVQQQFKKAGDVSKQGFNAERATRQFQFSEKQRQAQRTAEEFQQDIKFAQDEALKDLQEYETDVRDQWKKFGEALQKARNNAFDNLQKYVEDSASEEIVNGAFNGLNSIISGTLSLAGGTDTGGLIGQAISANRQRQNQVNGNQNTINMLESDLTGQSKEALQRRRDLFAQKRNNAINSLERDLINSGTISGLENDLISQSPSSLYTDQQIRRFQSGGFPETVTALRKTPPSSGRNEMVNPWNRELFGAGNPVLGQSILRTDTQERYRNMFSNLFNPLLNTVKVYNPIGG